MAGAYFAFASNMRPTSEVVITGVGVVSAVGIGQAAFWSSLTGARCGISELRRFDTSGLPFAMAAEIHDFDPKEYVRPRKSLKVMSRDIQLGVAAADLAMTHAAMGPEAFDPDRFGVVFAADPIRADVEEAGLGYRACVEEGRFIFERWADGAMGAANPLGMLKLLPNMLACHVSIIHDARAHNNTAYQGEISGILALGEAARVIERGHADCMIAGGASSRLNPSDWARSSLYEELSGERDDPARACRPFDRARSGMVRGEGGAAFVLENRLHAEARGAEILARLAGTASSSEGAANGLSRRGDGLRRAIRNTLKASNIDPEALGCVSAHGDGTRRGDALEASVLRECVGQTPVTAFKSYFGNLYSAAGCMEAAATVLALSAGIVPHTLGHETRDAECDIAVIRDEPRLLRSPAALVCNRTALGQAAAAVFVAP